MQLLHNNRRRVKSFTHTTIHMSAPGWAVNIKGVSVFTVFDLVYHWFHMFVPPHSGSPEGNQKVMQFCLISIDLWDGRKILTFCFITRYLAEAARNKVQNIETYPRHIDHCFSVIIGFCLRKIVSLHIFFVYHEFQLGW